MATAPKKRPALTPDQLVVKILKTRASGSRCYARADHYMKALRESVTVDQAIALSDEQIASLAKIMGESKLRNIRQARVVDLYANDDKVFRSHGIARYEVELCK